jgi:probable HAF family extracellular repeat protein
MSAKLLCRVAACATLSVLTSAPWALPSQYHLDDIGPETEGTDVNLSGQVSGIDPTSGLNQAFRWSGGTLVDLANPYESAYAYGINNAGAVVGNIGDAHFMHAALWRSPDVVEDVGAGLTSHSSSANAINDLGDCTISAIQDDLRWHAYYVPGCVAANAVDIRSLGAGATTPSGLNANGQITGGSNLPGGRGRRAFLYTDGHMKNLGLLSGDSSSEGRGLNGPGHVVGHSVDSRRHRMAFFHDGTKMRKLGTLGGAQSDAYEVNYFDVVVGTAQTASGIWHPFVFDKGTAGTTMRDLQTMLDASGAGWSLSKATAINNNGQIVVHGTRAGDIGERSALLTPVP